MDNTSKMENEPVNDDRQMFDMMAGEEIRLSNIVVKEINSAMYDLWRCINENQGIGKKEALENLKHVASSLMKEAEIAVLMCEKYIKE